MFDANTIQEIITKEWKDETTIVGKNTTHNICAGVLEGNVQILESKGGADFNAVEIAQVLIAAATLTKISLEIWQIVSTELGRKPTNKEVEEKVLSDKRTKSLTKEILSSVPSVITIISQIYK